MKFCYQAKFKARYKYNMFIKPNYAKEIFLLAQTPSAELRNEKEDPNVLYQNDIVRTYKIITWTFKHYFMYDFQPYTKFIIRHEWWMFNVHNVKI